MQIEQLNSMLKEAGIEFEHGLTDLEFSRIESTFSFFFPPDLREYLAFSLPTNRGFVNWRAEHPDRIREILAWPLEGIKFDIEHNNFWFSSWGERPIELRDAFVVASQNIDKAPTLIPIYGHRYIPAEPSEAGNPIFSVWQTDIIYYGSNLLNYFENEFSYYVRGPKHEHQLEPNIRRIEFWTVMEEQNG